MNDLVLHDRPVFFWLLPVLAITMLVAGCRDSSTAPPTGTIPAAVYKKPPSGFTDTITITGLSAVFFTPDSVQREEIRKHMPAMNYENDIHDCYYQIRNSKKVLGEHWPQIQVIDAVKSRFLLFFGKEQGSRCIDLDRQNNMCGLYLFNGNDPPEPADMTNIESALRFYFEKKAAD